MTTVDEIIAQLTEMKAAGLPGETEVVVGERNYHQPVTQLEIGLYEPREEGKRLTSIRKVFIS